MKKNIVFIIVYYVFIMGCTRRITDTYTPSLIWNELTAENYNMRGEVEMARTNAYTLREGEEPEFPLYTSEDVFGKHGRLVARRINSEEFVYFYNGNKAVLIESEVSDTITIYESFQRKKTTLLKMYVPFGDTYFTTYMANYYRGKHMVKTEYIVPDGTSSVIKIKRRNGLPVRMKYRMDNSEKFITSFRYLTFDCKGNWLSQTMKTQYKGQEPEILLIEREISYYE